MKKKIKYLTLAEWQRICNRHDECDFCPLVDICVCNFDPEDWDMESEVKVDE